MVDGGIVACRKGYILPWLQNVWRLHVVGIYPYNIAMFLPSHIYMTKSHVTF